MPSDAPPQQATAHSWRRIVGPAMLLPSLAILAWSSPLLKKPTHDVALPGHSDEERQRLHRLLHEPPLGKMTSLPADVIRVPSSDSTLNQPGREPTTDDALSRCWIDPLLLASINDNHFGIPVAERLAYEQFLALSRSAECLEWKRFAQAEVSFGLLMLESARWRGQLITVEGDLRRLRQIAATADSPTDTFEAWLFTADSGRNPYRVIVTKVPDDFPFADSIQPPRRVRVTGLFFKRFSYATENGFHSAPLLIAPELTAVSSARLFAGHISGRSGLLTIAALGALLILASIVAIGQITARRRHHAARLAAQELRNSQTPDFDFLNEPQ